MCQKFIALSSSILLKTIIANWEATIKENDIWYFLKTRIKIYQISSYPVDHKNKKKKINLFLFSEEYTEIEILGLQSFVTLLCRQKGMFSQR
jgi:hypothetical protein